MRSIGKDAKVGILASPASQQTHLFKHAFARQGLDVVFPEQQERLLAAIGRIKSKGPTEQDHEALSAAAQNCQDHGAACLLVGCSEFSLIADTVDVAKPVVDSLDVLVAEMIACSTSE